MLSEDQWRIASVGVQVLAEHVATSSKLVVSIVWGSDQMSGRKGFSRCNGPVNGVSRVRHKVLGANVEKRMDARRLAARWSNGQRSAILRHGGRSGR